MHLLSLLCSSHKTSHFSPAKVPKSSANVTAKVWRHAKILQWLRRLILRWSDSSSSSKCCRWRRVFPPRSYQTWRAPDEWSLIRKSSLSASFIGHEKQEFWESEVFLRLKSLICRKKRSFFVVKYQELKEIAFLLQLYVLHLCRIFNRPFIWKL